MTVNINASLTQGLVLTSDTSGVVAFQSNNAETMRIDTSGNVGIGTSSPGVRLDVQQNTAADAIISIYNANSGAAYGTNLVLNSANATGSYYNAIVSKTAGTEAWRIDGRGSANTIAFSTGSSSTERMRIDSSGNLLVNTTTADARFVVVDSATSGWGARILKSSGSGTPQGLQVVVGQNSSNEVFQCSQGTSFTSPTNLFKVQGNGLINTGAASVSPYNNTTASAANMVVTSAGDLQRSTSSLKYKTDVVDATHGLAEVLQLRPVTYKGKNDGDTVFGGLIAEEVDAVGLTEFVQYAEDGSPDALAYGNMVSLLVKAIQEQQSIISDLQSRIAALEAK